MEAKRPAMNQRLRGRDLKEDPIEQFELWFEEAKRHSGLPNPNAMTLCTFSPEGWPEGRPVLLKLVDASGFVFFTNLESDKGRSLLALPKAELVFHWDSLGKQVRIRGPLTQVSDAEADAYFASRARESQLAAWASSQSRPVSSRAEMDEKFEKVEKEFFGKVVPRPKYWSGFRLFPNRIEFWKDDPRRFHDRFRYSHSGDKWIVSRIYP
jgi:pyridoxamine 5'-phosphate oxidase